MIKFLAMVVGVAGILAGGFYWFLCGIMAQASDMAGILTRF